MSRVMRSRGAFVECIVMRLILKATDTFEVIAAIELLRELRIRIETGAVLRRGDTSDGMIVLADEEDGAVAVEFLAQAGIEARVE